MKKIFFVLSFALLGICVNAQNNVPKTLTTTSYGNTLDTVTNTATKNTSTYTVGDWFANKSVQVQVVVTKISGTVGGSIGLYGSMDGANWTLCETVTTASDASANYYISTTKRYYKYRVSWAGTGTMSASFKVLVL